MTLARRVATIEASLSPTQFVVRWLDEAHAFGDIESYVRSLLDAEPGELPLDRLVRETAGGIRATMRGKRGEVMSGAIRMAIREVVFRFELVMRINMTAHGLLERQALLDAALAAQVALLTSAGPDKRGTTYRDRLASRRDTLMACVDELLAAQEARTIVELRYLAGHAALFPTMATAWDVQLKSTKGLAVMALGLAEHDGCPAFVPADPDAISVRAVTVVADLVEPAKSTALEKLGDGVQALGIAQRWLGPKLPR